jgi:hypothetical protein
MNIDKPGKAKAKAKAKATAKATDYHRGHRERLEGTERLR